MCFGSSKNLNLQKKKVRNTLTRPEREIHEARLLKFTETTTARSTHARTQSERERKRGLRALIESESHKKET